MQPAMLQDSSCSCAGLKPPANPETRGSSKTARDLSQPGGKELRAMLRLGQGGLAVRRALALAGCSYGPLVLPRLCRTPPFSPTIQSSGDIIITVTPSPPLGKPVGGHSPRQSQGEGRGMGSQPWGDTGSAQPTAGSGEGWHRNSFSQATVCLGNTPGTPWGQGATPDICAHRHRPSHPHTDACEGFVGPV